SRGEVDPRHGPDRSEWMRFHEHQVWYDWASGERSEPPSPAHYGDVDKKAAFVSVKYVTFPEPADRNINMMPFRFGDKDSLPVEYQCYWHLIEECPYMDPNLFEGSSVGYLTVHESFVDATKAQRRQGLHIEAPGVSTAEELGNIEAYSSHRKPVVHFHWGMGRYVEDDETMRLEGGIFMASTVANTSQLWHALVDKSTPGIVDHHGGCEHLRPLLGQGQKLDANELIWMTDSTPHEALPQQESGYRQFFRVVTSEISHWHADHSTPNPLVPLPRDVTVVAGNKFA
ncbi:expressed unknown protein (Partial), partial [Seminavis robusta]